MSYRESLQKLRAYGVPYALRFRMARPVAAWARGFALRACVDGGVDLRVYGTVAVERDAGSVIRFGRGCQVQDSVSLLSTRAHARAPGAELSVGAGSVLKRSCMLFAKSSRLLIGERCAIGRFTELSCDGVDLTIGSGVRIASGVWIGTGNHVFADPDRPIVEQGVEHRAVTVEDDVWIGTHAVILPGTRVGRGSVVAAGAVVTRDVPPYSVVGGVPGRILKSRR